MNKDAYYFSHDCNARNDEKILAVRMRHGAEGYGIYFMIIERLLESTNYMSVKDYNIIAFDLRVGADKIKSIVEDFGLFTFTEDGKRFYSESLNKRMEPLDNLRKQRSLAGKKSAEKRKIQNAENQEVNNDRSTTVQRPLYEKSTKERKGKERKVNKIKEVVEEKGPLQPHVVGELVEASKIRVYKLDALETELKNSLMWKETIAIHNKISMEMVNTKISEFIEHLKLQGEEVKTLSDSKKHFNSWLRIMISKPNSDSKSKIVYDNPDLPPDNSGKWKWINGAWRDTTTFTTSQKRRHGLLPSG